MKLTFLALIFAGSISHATLQGLGSWNTDPKSVQAALFHILTKTANEEAQSKWPQNFITVESKKVRVGVEGEILTCEASSDVVVAYRCVILGSLDIATANADSAQAVLFESMRTLSDRRVDIYPDNLIQEDDGRLILKDQQTILKCSVGIRGIEAVQTYSCQIF